MNFRFLYTSGYKEHIYIFFLCLIFLGLSKESLFAGRFLVSTQEQFNAKVPDLVPGDTLVLKSGIWEDFILHFYGDGTAGIPITLMAEKNGKVIITGRSSLLLSGNYLIVTGLTFKNGIAASDAVISFRNGRPGKLANYTRVTNCSVENFGSMMRWEENYYVALWGKHNRVDHCYLGGKPNIGVTLAVFVKGEENWPNYHSIDHNHFGPRPRLGSNGGESIRFGDSGTSLNSSHTLLESNLFEKCNGETEIVSIKCSDNIIRNNLFFESEGSLVLRHGNRNLVEGNVFTGNFKPYTGGIRIVNNGHRIINNLLAGLNGDGFRAPLSVMCGLENSPLNRYEPVKDVLVEGNVWMACSGKWDIGVPFTRNEGEGEFVLPTNIMFKNNLVWLNQENSIVNYLSGYTPLTWENNYTNYPQQPSPAEFIQTPFGLSQFKSITLPVPGNPQLFSSLPINDVYMNSYNTVFGPDFRTVKGENLLNQTILVAPGTGTISSLVNSLLDRKKVSMILLSGHEYIITESIPVHCQMSFSGSSFASGTPHHPALSHEHNSKKLPVIMPSAVFKDEALFIPGPDGNLALNGIRVSGTGKQGNGLAKYGVAPVTGMGPGYHLTINGCILEDFNQDMGAAVKGFAGTFARTIFVSESIVENCTAGFSFDEEKKDNGRYNVEELRIENSLFRNNQGTVISLYRGGLDESTFGPFLYITHCEFNNNSGSGTEQLIKLTGVQVAEITHSIFRNNPGYPLLVTLYGPKNKMADCIIDKTDRVAGEVNLSHNSIVNKKYKQKDFRKAGLIPAFGNNEK
jgi:poly(beta-D-mannuronate) lyase